MKKIALLFSAVLAVTLLHAQQTITFRGKQLNIAGKSAGVIHGNGAPGNTYECFLDINKAAKTLTCTTVQTIGSGENNKDVVVKKVALSDLKIEFWDDEPDTDEKMFPQPVYKVVLQTKNYEKVVTVKANYRYMSEGEFTDWDNVYEILIVFKDKENAMAFIKQLNEFK